MMILLIVAMTVPLLLSILPLFLSKINSRVAGIASATIVLVSLLLNSLYLALNPTFHASIDLGPIIPSLWKEFPMALTFRVDVLSWLMSFLVSLVGFLCLVYSIEYMSEDEWAGRYYFWMQVFIGSMIGIVISDNLLLLVMFWELTTLSSFSLIGHWLNKPEASWGSFKALVMTSLGGICLIIAASLIYYWTGIKTIGELLSNVNMFSTLQIEVILFLFTIAIITKSSQFPFHTWLPDAMVAPTPVSSLLHAAAMVKAGVYLAARLIPVYAASKTISALLLASASITMVLSSLNASVEEDLKRILAYSTIGHLALMISAFSLSAITLSEGLNVLSDFLLLSGLFHLLNHSITKSSLFLVAGAVEHEVGTRNISSLGGLYRFMPKTSVAFLVCGLALVGFPPLNGFYSKWMLLQAFTSGLTQASSIAMVSAISLIGLITITVFGFLYIIRPALTVFLGNTSHSIGKIGEPPLLMWITPIVLSVFAVGIGIYPNPPIIMLSSMVRAASPGNLLQLQGAFTPIVPLQLSIALGICLIIGTAVVASCFPTRKTSPYLAGEGYEKLYGAGKNRISGPGFIYEFKSDLLEFTKYVDTDRSFSVLTRIADFMSVMVRRVHTGSLRLYAYVTLISIIILALIAWWCA